ncbi:MAG: mono/diheme cytochrome c family protein [Cyclobacteriaceae bacterium]|jgi:mono/diheme cytochrome c family protein
MLLKLFRLSFCFLFLWACEPAFEETTVDLSSYQIADSLQLSAVVAEPLIEAPIDISFDNQGRLWVLEMKGYMRTIEGVGENSPIGRVLIIEDLDQDGAGDHARVFLDSLILARAFTHYAGGLLYAEPPSLYFVPIKEDLTPGKRMLVDPEYAVGGNVEHQPNGLLVNIDNWIYNAKSSKRYRLLNGEWQIESTAFRGQWGITKDEIGRLIYNDNSNQAYGDWILPNTLYKPGYELSSGVYMTLVQDQSVYPLQATAVNRGYLPNVLDEQNILKRFTSACGPLYFQGESLPTSYQGNLFVCGPEANLIKRNLLKYGEFQVTGRQAWQNKEFLISSDQGFRPVNLKNGPDGAMYVIDMHRGIIQHSTYMTSYLRDQYISRGLDSLVGMGRILRIAADISNYVPVDLTKLNSSSWVDSLSSSNSWIRDRAQQLIINSGNADLSAGLVVLLNESNNEIARIHALYCLEGLQTLSKKDLNLNNFLAYPRLSSHVLKLVGDHGILLSNQGLDQLFALQDSTIDFYTVRLLAKNFNNSALAYLTQLLDRYNQSKWILEPLAMSFAGDLDFFRKATNGYDSTLLFIEHVQKTTSAAANLEVIYTDNMTTGLYLYRNNCGTCHGPDGRGLKYLAPPLLNSEYVSGDPQLLIDLMLYGLEGPIEVAGLSYDFATAMPGQKVNTSLDDAALAHIANYLRNAFTTSPRNVTEALVKHLREQPRAADDTYTQTELYEKYNIQ